MLEHIDGESVVRLTCDECGKTLYEWDSWDEVPNTSLKDFAPVVVSGMAVRMRVFFSPFPYQEALESVRFSLGEVWSFHWREPGKGKRWVGYVESQDANKVWQSNHGVEHHFCSDSCRRKWSLSQNQYGILVSQQGEQINLVDEFPDKFPTLFLGNFLPTAAKKESFVSLTKEFQEKGEIRIFGRPFSVLKSTVIMPGMEEPDTLISLSLVLYPCPSCGRSLGAIADFTPSVWICPHCFGGVLFDAPLNGRGLQVYLDLEAVLSKKVYFVGQMNAQKWRQLMQEGVIFNVADSYEGDSGVMVFQGTNVKNAINLFWYAIQD